MSFSESDLKEVRSFLYAVRLKWYDIGIELDIDPVELDEIKEKHNNDPSKCLREMIKVWLRSLTATMKALEDALGSPAVNEKKLASKGLSTLYTDCARSDKN